MSNYRLVFLKRARRQWNKLGATVRLQFERKLAERLSYPRVAGDRLRRYPHLYKIKLRTVGYRLIYRVDDDEVVVIVLTVDRREDVYDNLDDLLADGA